MTGRFEARVLLVTDPAYDDGRLVSVVESCARALPAGAFAVQLRDKALHDDAYVALAQRLRPVTRAHGASLLLNGRVHLVARAEADGVHLGADATSAAEARRRLGGHALIVVAAHADDDVVRAAGEGADGALVSPVFAVPGKGAPRGLEAVRRARALAPATFAILALGGIDRTNVAACREAGAQGVAVQRALLGASDPAAVAESLASPGGA